MEKKTPISEKVLTYEEAVFAVDRCLTLNQWQDALQLLRERGSAVDLALSSEKGELFRELRIAYCYVRMEQYEKAEYYLEGVLRTDKESPNALLLMAYLQLLRQKKGEGIFYYSALLNKKSYEKRARRILGELKSNKNLLKLVMRRPVSFFYPEPKIGILHRSRHRFQRALHGLSKQLRKKNIRMTSVAVLAVLALALYFLENWQPLKNFFKKIDPLSENAGDSPLLAATEEQQKLWSAMQLSPQESNLSQQGGVPFAKLFSQLKQDIAANEINKAIVTLNEALAYDPPIPIAERFRILGSFIPKPNFEKFENDISPEIVFASPTLHKNTYWKYIGQASSVVVRDKRLSMQLLVFDGDDLQRVLQLEFTPPPAGVETGKRYEVLMRFYGLNSSGDMLMQGVGLKRL